MKMNILLTLVSLGAALVSGCSTKAQTMEVRRQTSLRRIQSAESSCGVKDANIAQLAGAVLEALKAATALSLSKPVVVNAQLQELLHIPTGLPPDKFAPCRLFVRWLEDQPTPDGVEIKYRTNPPTILPITALDLNSERMTAKDSVVFCAGYSWTSISNFEAAIGPVASGNDLQVRLLRAAQPVADWSPVYCYTVDIGASTRIPSGQGD